MDINRVYAMSVASVYPHYITKAEKKGRTKNEVDQIISWLTGYNQKEIEQILENKINFESFFADAPKLNPNRKLIKGVSAVFVLKTLRNQLCRKYAIWIS